MSLFRELDVSSFHLGTLHRPMGFPPKRHLHMVHGHGVRGMSTQLRILRSKQQHMPVPPTMDAARRELTFRILDPEIDV